MIGLGWDTNKYDGGNDFDLDTSIFLLDETGKVKDQATSFSITTQRVETDQLSTQEII